MSEDKTILESSKKVVKSGLGFMDEFKEFIKRGNALDLAVGVIIGGAFQTIIRSLVEDMMMPLISSIIGGIDFSNWKLVLKEDGMHSITLNYGAFFANIINFLIMAFVIFIFIKVMNKLSMTKALEVEEEKTCPYCLSSVPEQAVKCLYCTSELEQ